MLIKTKIRYGSILLALVPAVIASVMVGMIAVDHAESAIKDQVQSRLTALREDRARQIVHYFESMRDQALVYNKDRMIIDAMREFSEAFRNFKNEIPVDVASDKSALKPYYVEEFSKEYSVRNNGQKPNVDQVFSKLDDSAIVMQQRYIKANPNPLGSKDALMASSDGSDYSQLHKKYHPSIRELQQRFGYYDIFLIDADTGHVVYSVFKELDYATSLKVGPFANSGLAEAYRGAMTLPSANEIFMTDFAPYFPSYMAPAIFITTPVFDGDKRVGILAFQLPIDRINNVMTGDEKWKESGLGESGETYLVGSDKKMRSQSRFWIEDKAGFIDAISKAGVDAATINAIKSMQTVIGLQSVNSLGVQSALNGETGFSIINDYRNVPVLSAYKPIEVNGQKWAILAEEDEEEAYAASTELHSYVVYLVWTTAIVLLVTSGVLGWLFSISVVRPLERIVASMKDISSGSGDLTVRMNDKANDELGMLARAFNIFVEKLDGIMSNVGDSTTELATASEELSMITKDTRKGIDRQHAEIQQVATAVEEMTATVKEVAQNASTVADGSRNAGSHVETGRVVVKDSSESIQHLSKSLVESQNVVNALQDDSERVGTVLDVIKSIAEQTNLLALNAAIEAARAGEQGRGFAVVADEVRVLAKRSQDSAEEIRVIIESLQNRSEQTTKMLQANISDLESTVDLNEKTQQAFTEIESAVSKLLEMSIQIANATEEQAAVTEEISRNLDNTNQEANTIASGSEQTAESSMMLARLGDDLKVHVNQFKVSGKRRTEDIDPVVETTQDQTEPQALEQEDIEQEEVQEQ
jgi:methyl-accepting chemotaxis protein